MKSERTPFDLDVLHRGDVVSRNELLRAARAEGFDGEKEHDKFRFFCVRLAHQIRTSLYHRGFGYVSVSCREYGIAILADGMEQLGYTRREKRRARSMFVQRHLEQCSINPELLPDEEREKWLRDIERDSKLISFERPGSGLPPLPKPPEEIREEDRPDEDPPDDEVPT